VRTCSLVVASVPGGLRFPAWIAPGWVGTAFDFRVKLLKAQRQVSHVNFHNPSGGQRVGIGGTVATPTVEFVRRSSFVDNPDVKRRATSLCDRRLGADGRVRLISC